MNWKWVWRLKYSRHQKNWKVTLNFFFIGKKFNLLPFLIGIDIQDKIGKRILVRLANKYDETK